MIPEPLTLDSRTCPCRCPRLLVCCYVIFGRPFHIVLAAGVASSARCVSWWYICIFYVSIKDYVNKVVNAARDSWPLRRRAAQRFSVCLTALCQHPDFFSCRAVWAYPHYNILFCAPANIATSTYVYGTKAVGFFSPVRGRGSMANQDHRWIRQRGTVWVYRYNGSIL